MEFGARWFWCHCILIIKNLIRDKRDLIFSVDNSLNSFKKWLKLRIGQSRGAIELCFILIGKYTMYMNGNYLNRFINRYSCEKGVL